MLNAIAVETPAEAVSNLYLRALVDLVHARHRPDDGGFHAIAVGAGQFRYWKSHERLKMVLYLGPVSMEV